jgi:Holliday junction resolvase
MNKHSKGKRREREAQLKLEAEGYLTERKPSTRWASDDFWELFDIIAIQPKTGEVRLVQVKSNKTDIYRARYGITDWVKSTGMVCPCEIWLKEDRKDWVIEWVNKPQ